MILILFVEGKLCTNFALPGSKKRDQKQQRTDAFSGESGAHVWINPELSVRWSVCTSVCGCSEDDVIGWKVVHLCAVIVFMNFFNQVAVMSGHFELGEIIKNHRDTDVGK